jgi:hypothetical protein
MTKVDSYEIKAFREHRKGKWRVRVFKDKSRRLVYTTNYKYGSEEAAVKHAAGLVTKVKNDEGFFTSATLNYQNRKNLPERLKFMRY